MLEDELIMSLGMLKLHLGHVALGKGGQTHILEEVNEAKIELEEAYFLCYLSK
jgi:hypothetical protein